MALTDQTGQVTWAAKLHPWDNVLQEYNPQGLQQAIRLPGQHHDRETGLHYNRHRQYDPELGAYINQDPIGLNGGTNISVYAPDPLQWIDSMGLVWWADAVNNGLGILGNAGGAIVGGALLAAPEPTQVTKVAGSAVLSKSVYGFGASWYGFTRALSDDPSYDIPSDQSSLPRSLVCAAGCNDAGRGAADVMDLSVDLAVGKIPVNNKIKLPIQWGMDVDPPWKLPVSSMFTPRQNTALDVLQGATAAQSMMNSGASICKKQKSMKIDHKSSLVHCEKYSDIYAGLVSILMNLMLIINLFENSVSLLFGFLFYIFCGLYIFGAGSRELRRKKYQRLFYFLFILFHSIFFFWCVLFIFCII